MWTGADWRPILGTSVDSQVSPVPLTTREEQLLLSQWMRVSDRELSVFNPIHTWLGGKKDLPQNGGPDYQGSPRPCLTHSSGQVALLPFLRLLQRMTT